MKYTKEKELLDEIDMVWVVSDENKCCEFVFYDECMADLMLFCLERIVA